MTVLLGMLWAGCGGSSSAPSAAPAAAAGSFSSPHFLFQYTTLDDCTRFRVLRLYRTLNQASSLAFLQELRLAAVRNGPGFAFEFALAVEAAGIRHCYIDLARIEMRLFSFTLKIGRMLRSRDAKGVTSRRSALASSHG